MKKERINYLLDQYLSGQLSEEESAELLSITGGSETSVLEAIRQVLESDIALGQYTRMPEPDPRRREEILNRILALDKTLQAPSRRKGLLRPLYRYAWQVAGVIALLMMAAAVYLLQHSPRPAPQTEQFHANIPAAYTRSFTLPDSSFVVLKAGSTLEWPETFMDGTREVTLSGEAYFDIRHLQKAEAPGGRHPFIIHTGKVKTTVLGTAFRIKAYPQEKDIVVAVTKGRVKVEDESRVLAILTQDQRITYTIEDSGSRAEQADSQKGMDWVRADMEFDGVSFENIARVLEKRYGVEISFSDPQLQDCMIVATFSGTETLLNVLETLCTIRNAAYRPDGPARFTIMGNGCD